MTGRKSGRNFGQVFYGAINSFRHEVGVDFRCPGGGMTHEFCNNMEGHPGAGKMSAEVVPKGV